MPELRIASAARASTAEQKASIPRSPVSSNLPISILALYLTDTSGERGRSPRAGLSETGCVFHVKIAGRKGKCSVACVFERAGRPPSTRSHGEPSARSTVRINPRTEGHERGLAAWRDAKMGKLPQRARGVGSAAGGLTIWNASMDDRLLD